MRMLLAILVASAAFVAPSQPACAQSDCSIHGQVSDPLGAVIAKATIRVLDAHTRQTIGTFESDKDGSFAALNLAAGEYLIAASATGFKEKLVSIGTLKAGSTTSLTIRLNVLDCDAPGVNCDIFSTGPVTEPHPVIAQHDLTIHPGNAIDLEHAAAAPQPSDADVKVTSQSGGLFIQPLNNAIIYAECGAGGTCGKDHATLPSVRIDGLGPRSEFCIKTRHGQCSKIFLTQHVDPSADQVAISVVTRAK